MEPPPQAVNAVIPARLANMATLCTAKARFAPLVGAELRKRSDIVNLKSKGFQRTLERKSPVARLAGNEPVDGHGQNRC